jgi:hypothetical protein
LDSRWKFIIKKTIFRGLWNSNGRVSFWWIYSCSRYTISITSFLCKHRRIQWNKLVYISCKFKYSKERFRKSRYSNSSFRFWWSPTWSRRNNNYRRI